MTTSNYEIQKYRTAEFFLQYDQDAIIRKLDLKYDENYLFYAMFDKHYRMNRATAIWEWKDMNGNWKEAGFGESMTLYDLFGYSADNAVLAGTYASVYMLNGRERIASKPGGSMASREELFFDEHPQELEEALIQMGGVKEQGKGDLLYRLPIFPFMDFLVQFYFSDDEFPPKMTILWDSNMLQYIHFETVFYAAGVLYERLNELTAAKAVVSAKLPTTQASARL